MVTLAFVVLKLTGYVSWSWVWVVSPLWIALILWVLFIIVGLYFIIKAEKLRDKDLKEKEF